MRAGEAKLSPNDPVDPLLLETTDQQRSMSNSVCINCGGRRFVSAFITQFKNQLFELVPTGSVS